MPLPSPKKGEKQQAYVSRCISFVKKDKPNTADKQAQAMCFSNFKRTKVKGKMIIAGGSATSLEPIRAVDGENRYRAYAVMFGDDENRDLYSQFFTKETDYHLDWFDKRPWLYHHGIHPDMGTTKIGEWDTIGVDDEGVFLEGERLMHHKYTDAVDTLLSEGVLYPSSGTLPYVAKFADDGRIVDWPIVEVSSTVLPAEYRMNPISPAAVRAIQKIGGETMSVRAKIKAAIDDIIGDEPVADDAAGDAADETGAEDTTDTKGSGDNPGTGEATAPTVEEIGLEVARAIDLPKIVTAIKGLDGVIKELVGRLDAVETGITKLQSADVEKLKKAVEGDDWYGGLFVATRSADKASADDVKGAKDFGKPQVGPNGEEVDVWGAISGGQGA